MFFFVRKTLILIVVVIVFPLLLKAQSGVHLKRERLLMDFGWRFAFGHPYDSQKDFRNGTSYFSYLTKAGYGDGAAAANFDDRAWRKLDLPHDWAVEQAFSSNASFSHGFKAIGRNFPETSVGWYRKTIAIPKSDLGRRISIVFDGVFRNSIVWVNGHYLGNEQSGYNSFEYDITDYINYGGDNTIAVRVDATMEEGWYYEGAGIYRHVWLTKTAPLHVITNGTFVSAQVDGKNAIVSAKVEVMNDDRENKAFQILQTITDREGKIITQRKLELMTLRPFEKKEVATSIPVKDARLWDIESPYLYRLVTTIFVKSDTVDIYTTKFGIRTIRFDAKEGFFLNDRQLKLKGTNNHQDHAGVGTALPDELQYWRIKQLKTMGSNAYRCSHHPPTPELLDVCDSLGMLVIDENRLMGTSAKHLEEVKRLIIRDRNHPSIISWSIGNEEWAIENNIIGERIAQTMQKFVKSLDTTRSTTAGISGGFRSGISSVLEVMGYNYMGNGDIEAHYKDYPNQPGMGTEEGSTFATRGEYENNDQKHYRAAYDQKPRPTFYSIEEGWKFYATRPYLAGMFIWTGFDYRGEPTPYGWPSVTSYFGMMDLCGFPKDNFYYLKSWWTEQPTLHLLPHWNWHGKEGKEIKVWAHSNCEEVELFLNKKSLGREKMHPYGHLEWSVPYTPGTLEAIGYKSGKRVATDVVKTAGEVAVLRLTAHKSTLAANREDISIITVEALDKKGLPVPVASNEITFQVQGPAKIIGVGNGDPTSLENEKYIEAITTIAIEGLEEKALAEIEYSNAFGKEDVGWKEAFKNRDFKNLAKAYAYRGYFMLPNNIEISDITLFYRSIGQEQTLFINGHEVARKMKVGEEGEGLILNKTILKPGKNSIQIIATPIPKRHEWDNVNTDPGLIQVFIPPAQWKRKLFNGLAQVIVQSTQEAGIITITAKTNGVKSSSLQLNAKQAQSRALVK